MKQFRLLKTYPGSPPINTIIEEAFENSILYKCIKPPVYLAKENVENYPEYWEEVQVKKPLFTTEDGVDIFKGDRCWAGDKGSLLFTDYVHGIFQGNDESLIYFDNLTRLEKYIDSLNAKVIKEETVSHKIISFGPNPKTGGIYTFNKHTNEYHSDISQARIPYKECFRYPVRSVTNTEKNFFKRGDCVNRLDTKSNTKYDIIYFEPVRKKKIIYVHISTKNTRARLIKINIDNLEHFVK